VGAQRSLLAAVSLSAILAPLNSTMIAVGLPEILDDFHSAVSSTAWLVTGYLVALAVLQPFTGRLGDRVGRRPLMLGGLAAFALASLGAALAPDLAVLALFRILQAVAAAAITPTSFAIVGEAAAPGRRGAVFGLVALGIGASASAGPLIGGLLVAAGGWRAIFLGNLPVTALAFALVWRAALPATVRAPESSLRGLARSRPFLAALGGVALGNLSFYTTLIALPIVLRGTLGWSGAEIGLAATLLTAPSIVFAPLGGRVADRIGRRRPAFVGHALAAAGLLPLALGQANRPGLLLAGLAVSGVGFGLTLAPLQASAIESADPAHAGAAAGIYSTGRYVGSIAGSVALSALLVSSGTGVDGVRAVGAIVAGAALLAAVASLGLHGRTRAAAGAWLPGTSQSARES
jgi:DHA2 family methylenomycin A resistance protein-like MFS transporter